MHSPSLAAMAGQLFVLGFRGATLSPGHPILDDIQRHNLGGVILFDRLLAEGGRSNNIVDPEQLRALTAGLQEEAGGRLLIAVDQEGGRVCRLQAKMGFAETAAAADLGRKDDPGHTAVAGATTATMLAAAGVNWNLAPVVDLNIFPDNPIIGRFGRSFADDPAAVARHARAWIEAHRAAGVLTCLKHFPGHGSSRGDSHLGFVDCSDSWQEIELEPYRQLLAADLGDAVMVGHLFIRHLDPKYPASLSRATIGGLLRQELGYTGPVVTDDLQMGAITSRYRLDEACCRALAAGADLLILGNNLQHDPAVLPAMIAAIIAGLKAKTVREERLTEAWQRVQRLKQHLGASHASS